MKKVLIVLLMLIFVMTVTACASKQAEPSAAALDELSGMEEKLNEIDGEIEAIVSQTDLGVTASEFLDNIKILHNDEVAEFKPTISGSNNEYSVDTYRTYLNTNGITSVYANFYTKNGEDKVSAIYLVCRNELKSSTLREMSASFDPEIDFVTEEFKRDKMYVYAYASPYTDLAYKDLPLRIRSETDFLNDETRVESMLQKLRNFDLAGIHAMAEAFIEETDCESSDSAYQILELLSDLSPLESCNVNIDSFNSNNTVTYKGLADVSQSVHMVPNIRYSGKDTLSLEITVGFVRSDWLFFDAFHIASGSSPYTLSGLKPQRDVLGGGSVMEKHTFSHRADSAALFLNADNPSIQFENKSNNQTLEYNFSETELNALETMIKIYKMTDGVRKTAESWNDPIA